jgi:hypothetical protein
MLLHVLVKHNTIEVSHVFHMYACMHYNGYAVAVKVMISTCVLWYVFQYWHGMGEILGNTLQYYYCNTLLTHFHLNILIFVVTHSNQMLTIREAREIMWRTEGFPSSTHVIKDLRNQNITPEEERSFRAAINKVYPDKEELYANMPELDFSAIFAVVKRKHPRILTGYEYDE